MNSQRVEFVLTKESSITTLVKDNFQFRKDKKYHRIQKLLFWGLKKLECYAETETVFFEKHTVATNNFLDALLQQEQELIALYNVRGAFVLIGSEDFSRMTNTPEIRNVFEFSSMYHRDNEICGMRVKVIPWMRGVLVVPELN